MQQWLVNKIFKLEMTSAAKIGQGARLSCDFHGMIKISYFLGRLRGIFKVVHQVLILKKSITTSNWKNYQFSGIFRRKQVFSEISNIQGLQRH